MPPRTDIDDFRDEIQSRRIAREAAGQSQKPPLRESYLPGVSPEQLQATVRFPSSFNLTTTVLQTVAAKARCLDPLCADKLQTGIMPENAMLDPVLPVTCRVLPAKVS